MRLRTQLVLVTVLISCTLTGVSLFVVRQSVRAEFRRQTAEAKRASVSAFERVNREHEADLRQAAALLSELPTLKAVMTTEHAATIQDASRRFWDLSATDLFVLTGPGRDHAFAVHASTTVTQKAINQFLSKGQSDGASSWWQNGTELFRVVQQPIIAGSGTDEHLLGYLFVGRLINDEVAQQMGNVAGSDVALSSGSAIVASTLDAVGNQRLTQLVSRHDPALHQVQVNGQPYEISAINLETDSRTPLHCYILFPLRSTNAFLKQLNQTIVLLGVLVAVVGGLVMVIVARAMTTPLDRLMKAVRAFAAGDDRYSMTPGGSMEISALANDFATMRQQLTEMQKRRLEAERLAALGRAAGSISHDLRHHLAAVVANAEFLHDSDRLRFDRDEIFKEIERASAEMTGLLDSLLDISRENVKLIKQAGDLKNIVTHAADAVRSNPEFRIRNIEVRTEVSTTGEFDCAKLQRAFFNLLQNACEATNPGGRIGVTITGSDSFLECLVWDTGPGVPDSIRDSIFEPFVSAGKNNGTGLGLAIAAKIVHDHGGQIRIDETSPNGTTFRVRIPRGSATVPTDASSALA